MDRYQRVLSERDSLQEQLNQAVMVSDRMEIGMAASEGEKTHLLHTIAELRIALGSPSRLALQGSDDGGNDGDVGDGDGSPANDGDMEAQIRANAQFEVQELESALDRETRENERLTVRVAELETRLHTLLEIGAHAPGAAETGSESAEDSSPVASPTAAAAVSPSVASEASAASVGTPASVAPVATPASRSVATPATGGGAFEIELSEAERSVLAKKEKRRLNRRLRGGGSRSRTPMAGSPLNDSTNTVATADSPASLKPGDIHSPVPQRKRTHSMATEDEEYSDEGDRSVSRLNQSSGSEWVPDASEAASSVYSDAAEPTPKRQKTGDDHTYSASPADPSPPSPTPIARRQRPRRARAAALVGR